MTQLHVVRVFLGPGGTAGNLLAVFLDGAAIPPERRLIVTAELGFSETVFVDDVATGRIAIFVPTAEVPFAGHPIVGTAWLLAEVGRPTSVLRPPAGDVPTRSDDGLSGVPPAPIPWRWSSNVVIPAVAVFICVEGPPRN